MLHSAAQLYHLLLTYVGSPQINRSRFLVSSGVGSNCSVIHACAEK